MNKRFSYDNMFKSRLIEPNDIIRTFKLDRCCDFMEEKYTNPKLTQKEICNRLQISDKTIRRFRDDIDVDNPYRLINNKKKKPKQLPDTKPIIDQSSKNKIIEKRIKNKLKNDIKGGNIIDIHTISGEEFIDHDFESNKMNSILENKQEDNTKLFNIARKMVNSN